MKAVVKIFVAFGDLDCARCLAISEGPNPKVFFFFLGFSAMFVANHFFNSRVALAGPL